MAETSYDNRQLAGRTAVDRNYSKIGTIADVYVDDATGQPEWLAVKTGLFGNKVSFVPLAGVHTYGDDVVVPYDAAIVKDAPRAETDGTLDPAEQRALYAHYGKRSEGTSFDTPGRKQSRGRRSTGYDTSGPETDDAMTRSEEQLDVNKRTRKAGTARLRKWIETEDVEIRVPVQREKARLVTEPINDANRDKAMAGPDLSTEEHEVVLNEEVIEVNKRVVPKERVRLETEIDTEEILLGDTVRKERIDFDDDSEERRRTGR